MHPHTIEEMLDALRSVLKDRARARRRLEKLWSNQVAIVWNVADVHRAANERALALTDTEARQVLRYLFEHHNAQYGLKWQDLTERIEDRVLGRKLTKHELHRFVHKDIITIQEPAKRKGHA